MTRRDTLQTVHEPFGDAFYFGPERLHDRYENDPEERMNSGFGDSTYRTIFDNIARDGSEGKRVFIKDMAYYWMPPDNNPPKIAPSLINYKRGVGTNTTELSPVTTRTDKDGPPYPYPTEGEPGNPTVLPRDLLSQFHFTFLIRHPKHSIPSYQRCTTAPLDKVTGWNYVNTNEAGYSELRRLFDYLRKEGIVGPRMAGESTNGTEGEGGKDSGIEICVLDADDVLDNPSAMIEAYCKSTGIKYEPEMLKWEEDFHQKYAKEVFEKWRGWHDDAINSSELKARTHKKAPKTDEQLYAEWTEKYGEKAATWIRDTVKKNEADYEYLKQFAIKPN
ncbi:helicase [Paraconiothyrium brasiliense]|uniref:Helicase n=1 Tax=Paraconiothyrium brasiliense TaxID=300254 RepID=A0ABR3QKM6_9PLEO